MVTGIRGEIFEEQLVEYFEKFGNLESVLQSTDDEDPLTPLMSAVKTGVAGQILI